MGLPLRDDHDLLFEQFAVDSWMSFARTYEYSPDARFLKARAFTNTSAEVGIAGLWQPVSEQGLMMKRLQWPAYETELSEKKQCDLIVLPLDYSL